LRSRQRTAADPGWTSTSLGMWISKPMRRNAVGGRRYDTAMVAILLRERRELNSKLTAHDFVMLVRYLRAQAGRNISAIRGPALATFGIPWRQVRWHVPPITTRSPRPSASVTVSDTTRV